ncbi:proline racemase [Caminicella sporogenes DSM 14501]|uniref:Proline racemase n=1 Tax=Caminicella sporogenes DSM 14501 TaxID=1121266 RepID=A0A1M6RQU4_9FIRM|nr:proline racemase [Caminicella sporogenes]RKD23674.1 proline racemase [Caminicella sporogenes]WIF94016.1 proline racemase [Caminicella sporogenes]SHK34813.1 proline racemase [Caminicella sporogenes DSM 14501]
MRAIRSIHAVDSHTMGEPTRIVIGGIPNIPGKTMAEKKAYLENEMDHIRKSIMLEPRGHNDMFGSVITSSVHEEADFGIIFMDGGGYLNMCGHGSIGAVTVAIETGIIKAVEPYTNVVMDTPAGIVKAKAKVENGKVKEVSIVNVPAFHYKKDVEIDVPGIGKVVLDISFGGSFFAIVDAKQLGLKVAPQNTQKLIEVGLNIRDIINKSIEIQHPELEHIKTVDLVEIYDEPTHPDANLKNVVIFGQGQVDRSPCGTGTSAKLATLYSKGKIKENELFVYESILGTLFKGRVVGTTEVKGYKAIIPEITGSAYITGFNHFLIDPDDPLKYGFVLK